MATGPIRPVTPRDWPRPRGYANGLLVPAGRHLLFVAGMVAWDEHQKIVPGSFVTQFEQALRNVLAVVDAGGGRIEDIVRMCVYVTDRDAYVEARGELGDVWRRIMGRHYPAMALVQVAGLVEAGALVEIEAVAAVDPTSPSTAP